MSLLGGEWKDHASCRGQYTEDYYFDNGQPPKAMQHICKTCPVLTSCTIASIAEKHGYWAGMESGYRQRLRRKANITLAELDGDVARFNSAADRALFTEDLIDALAPEVGVHAAHEWMRGSHA